MDYTVYSDNIQLQIESQTSSASGMIVDQLIEIRKRNHLTQQDIANATGMQRGNIARIESKKYVPTLEVLMRYADCLGYTIRMTLEETKNS